MFKRVVQVRLLLREAGVHPLHVEMHCWPSSQARSLTCTHFQADPALLDEQQAAHRLYSEERWALLVPEDVEIICKRGWEASYVGGIGGIINPSNIKCLHCHLAHYLATGSNVVGRWTQEALDAKLHLLADTSSAWYAKAILLMLPEITTPLKQTARFSLSTRTLVNLSRRLISVVEVTLLRV